MGRELAWNVEHKQLKRAESEAKERTKVSQNMHHGFNCKQTECYFI
jgi:hypothetical protein